MTYLEQLISLLKKYIATEEELVKIEDELLTLIKSPGLREDLKELKLILPKQYRKLQQILGKKK